MFMRTETEVHKREVLAIWVKSCMSQVQENYSNLTAAIKQTDMGKNADFLHTSSTATYITQGTNNIRRSCIAIFLDKLPPQLRVELKKGT